MKRRSTLILFPVIGAALFWMGFQSARDDDFYAMRKNFELFGAVYEQVVGAYMVRVDPERFMRTGMDAMLETLDPWTDFLDEADNVAMELRGQSGLAEVDVNLGSRNGTVTVLAPDAMTGAYRQGVRTGDVIESIAGQSAADLGLAEVYQLLRGQPGTAVEVTVVREGDGALDFVLKREVPSINYVSYGGQLGDGPTALVKLDAFGPGMAREVDDALEDVEEAIGQDLEGVVLDLRGNPGGLVSEAISLVGLFVPKDTPVVSTRGKAPESNRLYATDDDPDWGDVDLVLLVDQGSASASEIVSGALQDLDRAVVIGQSTFGKGLVQVVRPMPYHTALKMTYSRYFTPAGRGIRKDAGMPGADPVEEFRTTNGRTVREGNGIEPDVPMSSPDPSALETALLREAAYFRFAGVLAAEEGELIRAASRRSGRVEMPGDTIDRFQQWLTESGFDYTSDLDRRIDAVAALDLEGTSDPIQQLRDLSASEEEAEFEGARDRMMRALRAELAARLLDPADRIQMTLEEDTALLEATAVLGSDRYGELLGS